MLPVSLHKAVKHVQKLGRGPYLGRHIPNDPFPSRFYVQVTPVELVALVIPESFTNALLNDTNIIRTAKDKDPKFSGKIDMPIWVKRFCHTTVELQWVDDHLVLLNGWERLARRLMLHVDDILAFKYKNGGFILNVLRYETSTSVIYTCGRH